MAVETKTAGSLIYPARLPDQVLGDGKSWIRRLVDPQAFRLMRGLHHVLPFVTPNHLTDLSTGLQLALTFIQEEAHIADYKLSATEMTALVSAKAVVYSGDKFDGSLADVYDVEEPGQHDRSQGNRRDARRDRQREGLTYLLRARTEFLKGNFFGEMTNYVAAYTASEPSKRRAEIEAAFGLKPPEAGGNPLKALGTNGFRIGFTEVAGLRTFRGFYIRPWVDLACAAANLYTAHSRRVIYERYKDAVPPPQDEKEELKRTQVKADAVARLEDIKEVQRNILKGCVATFIALRVGSREWHSRNKFQLALSVPWKV